MITVTTYIASDGKEFKNEGECVNYEVLLTQTIEIPVTLMQELIAAPIFTTYAATLRTRLQEWLKEAVQETLDKAPYPSAVVSPTTPSTEDPLYVATGKKG